MVEHFYMVDEWLLIALEDPDLPDELLPATWPRDDARALFVELHDLIAPLGALLCATCSPGARQTWFASSVIKRSTTCSSRFAANKR